MLIVVIPTYADQFKIIRVYDGDSVKATGCDIEIKVRLVGIDAPEKAKRKHQSGQPYNVKATKFLSEMVLNKTVVIRDMVQVLTIEFLVSSPLMAKTEILR